VKALDSQTYSDQILDMVLGLLFICGWSLNSPRSQKAILSMQQMVRAIEKLWMQLKSATKEGITTSDMEVYIIDFGRPHDDGMMEDNYADASSRTSRTVAVTKKGQVLCTVGLGLRKVVMKRTDSGPEKQVDVLVKAKVAFESVLNDVGAGLNSPSDRLVSPSRMDGRS